MALLLFFLYIVFSLIVLYKSLPLRAFEVVSAIYFIVATFVVGLPWLATLLLFVSISAVILVLRLDAVRLALSGFLFKRARHAIPTLSKTEEEALNAGDTWFERDIFTGHLDWDALLNVSTALTAEEQAFLDNETQVLCSMLNDWEINQAKDLPLPVWTYLKENGFFGLVIEKEYGGKGFSARAHSDIVLKIASRSGVAAVTVMVPNSLGPGELLHHYGTTEQKKHYLPRLAKGIDIPCFALTEPTAGSDATSIQSEAIVVKKKIEGKSVLGLKLTLNKRWITLSPIATLIGVAVNLKDPEGLLKGEGQEGITCLLISRDHENLDIGNRHLPADQPFMNGTIRGQDIFVPIDAIIGGQEKAGQGWQMLVECLSIGRSISLPALGAASASVSYIGTSAFARLRRQFNLEIGHFEGVQEKLAEIGGLTYLVRATRLLTVAAVNEQKKPSVASAITKYFNTEIARIVVNNAMDIHAGRAVVVGPRNYMTSLYLGLPISITVEGANIMSRNLLIFGQGSMACHPYIREEFYAIRDDDQARFHTIIWEHIAYFAKNMAKAICTTWTGGYLVSTPSSKLKRSYQRLGRLSYAFAWISDLALIYLGGTLKRKERLSARLADTMSYLYMAMAVLKLCKEHDEDTANQLHAEWALSYCFYHAQKAMLAFCQNFPSRAIGYVIRFLLFPFGQTMRYPNDRIDHQLADLMMSNNACRDDLLASVYLSGDSKEPLDKMENALQAVIKHEEIYKKIKALRRYNLVEFQKKLKEKVDAGEITEEEMQAVLTTERARWDAMQVDEFSFESMKAKTFSSLTDKLETPFD